MEDKTTEVSYHKGHERYSIYLGDKEIFFGGKLEEDTQRLKRAFDHLIKLLKAEPDTDPFAN